MTKNGNGVVDAAARGKIIQRLGQMHYENALLQAAVESQNQMIAALQAEIEQLKAPAPVPQPEAQPVEAEANG